MSADDHRAPTEAERLDALEERVSETEAWLADLETAFSAQADDDDDDDDDDDVEWEPGDPSIPWWWEGQPAHKYLLAGVLIILVLLAILSER